MKKLLTGLFALMTFCISAQKVEDSELKIPYKHSPLFSFASNIGGMMDVYFEGDSKTGDPESLQFFRREVVSRIGLFSSFDLENYTARPTSKGSRLKVIVKAAGTPVLKIEDATGYSAQGYGSRAFYYKRGTYIVEMTADIRNDKNELLKTIIISNEKTPHITCFFDANLEKNFVSFFREYYSRNLNFKTMDSARKMFQPAYFTGYNSNEQLDQVFKNREAQYSFENVIMYNAFNDAVLNLNYILKAGLESVDKIDVFKLYSIAPKKEKEADKYSDEMRAGDLLNKALAELQKNNYGMNDAARNSLQQAKTLYETTIKKSDKDLGQGMKSMMSGNSGYYNALFNNGAIVDMLLGHYDDMAAKIERYEAAESIGDAFKFKKLAGSINYKLDFVTRAQYRGKIEKGKAMMLLLNP
jgi:hypothetical protein